MKPLTLTELELVVRRTRNRIYNEMNFQMRDQYAQIFDLFANELLLKQRENETLER